jgi:hypothetical protein
VGNLTVKELERNISKLKLNKDWTKSTIAFVTHISRLLSDHLELNPRPAGVAHWTKSTIAFLTHISHLLSDHLGMNRRTAGGAYLKIVTQLD